MCNSVDMVDDLAGHGQRSGIVVIEKSSCLEAHTVVPNLLISGGTHSNGINFPWLHGAVMLLMSLYVVPVLVLTMKTIIQGHACDDLTGTHGGGYAIVMW